MINQNQSKIGKCDVCEQQKIVHIHYGNMYFCDECWIKEQHASEEHQSLANQQKRVDELHEREIQRVQQNEVLRKSQEIDQSIVLRTDLFNAATTSIIEIKKAIDSDEKIENKPYELAKVLTERFNHFKTIVFELNQKLVEAGNEQKAIQVYLNNLANQLRAEEREKLRLQDINYKPLPVVKDLVKSIKTRQTNPKTKIDKKELRDAAGRLNISEFTLQMICVQKNLSVKDAVEFLKNQINQSKQS